MFDSKKAIQVLVYSIQYRGGMADISMALAIVWLSDRLHSRKYGCTITGDEYVVTENGIFPAELNRMISEAGFRSPATRLYFQKQIEIMDDKTLKARECFDNNVLSAGEIHCIWKICDAIFKLAQDEISDMKNFFSAWTNCQPLTDMVKSRIYNIDEVDFLLDVDIKIKTNKLIEIFTKEMPLNLELSKPGSKLLPKGDQDIFTNYNA